MSDFDNEEYEEFDLGDDRRTPRPDGPDPGAGEAGTSGTDEAGDTAVHEPDPPDADSDEADDSDDEEADDDEDEPEDATEEDIDFVIAAYREDGQPVAQALAADLANDLEELVVQLRRLPADAGSLGFVSLVEEVFVLVRVRGQHVQVLLSDGSAANDWPIARDVADLLGVDIPDPDDEPEPMGDLDLLADMGLSGLDLGAIVDNLDLSSDQMLTEVADKIMMGREFRRAVDLAFPS
jgi:putative tRNA adenosine deaminase-associated protein